jgi:oligoendopeptidase F
VTPPLPEDIARNLVADAPPQWDLSDLFSGSADPRLNEIIAEVKTTAQAFAERYRGKVAELAPAALAEAIKAFESIYQTIALPGAYASLVFAAQTTPENGAFMQSIRERITEATLPLIFFDVELTALGEDKLHTLADAPALAAYRHYLYNVARRARFRLSEVEERILEEQSNTGRRAFVRLFDEMTSSLRFTVPGHEKPLTLPEAIDLQHHPDRAVRIASAEAITAGLQPTGRTIAYIFNTLLQDKALDDRRRGHGYPEEARHIANELTLDTVETVVKTATDGYPLVARFYEAKRRLLGLENLAHYDRYAPVSEETENIPFDDARTMVLDAFSSFDARYEDAARHFFDGGWIDAAPAPNKRGGAFCSYITPDKHPYIFLTYLGKQGDIRTLAHELGHGIHSFLSRGQSYFSYHGTLPMAEVASTFAEMLVFDKMKNSGDDKTRLALYAHQIDQAIATIFRQAALYRFEQAIHKARRESGELSVEKFGEIWQENVGAMFAGSVTMEPGHAIWWSYVSHFVATPFYVYAYTFGEMLALALYARYRQEGEGFPARYLDMLSAGGSLSPDELVAPMNVDLQDPAFWQGALLVLEEQVTAFEALAEQFTQK